MVENCNVLKYITLHIRHKSAFSRFTEAKIMEEITCLLEE